MFGKKKKVDYKIPTITRSQQKKRILKDILMGVVPCLVLIIIFKMLFLLGAVPSASMMPLMNMNSGIVGSRMAYKTKAPRRGDVIVFRKGNAHMTKRIIGLPGDTVALQNGLVYINEMPVIEEYLAEQNSTEPLNGVNYYEVPNGHYFVLGDNREQSQDSRAWTEPFIPLRDIEAKVVSVFSVNPLAYEGVREVLIEEAHTGSPAFSDKELVTVPVSTESGKGTENEEVASTLPVVTIAPEEVTEPAPTEAETTEEETTGEEMAAEPEESLEDMMEDGE